MTAYLDALLEPLKMLVGQSADGQDFVPQPLGRAGTDVLLALVDEAFQQGQTEQPMRFEIAALLRRMGWASNSRSYALFRSCLQALSSHPLVRASKSPAVMLESVALWRPGQGQPGHGRSSQVQFGRALLEDLQQGRVRQMHPYYFRSGSRVRGRVFALLTAYGRGGAPWDAELFWLREVLPLRGRKYSCPSAIRQTLEPSLRGLEEDGALVSYRWIPSPTSPRKVQLVPSSDFVYGARPKHNNEPQGSSLGKPNSSPAVAALLERGVFPRTAAEQLVAKFGEAAVHKQTEYFDFIGGSGKANPGGYLRWMLECDCPAPEGFRAQHELAELRRRDDLVGRARRALARRELEVARQLASERLTLGPSSAAERILQEAEELLKRKEEDHRIDGWISSLDNEAFEQLREAASQRARQLLGARADDLAGPGTPLLVGLMREEARSTINF